MSRSKFGSFFTRIIRQVRNIKFARESRIERSKKYLYSGEKQEKKSWFEIYQKAKRGAYFRPFYTSYARVKGKFRLVFGAMGVFLIGASIYIFAYSPYFLISPNRVFIESLDTYSDINIANRSIESLYGTSLWSVSKNDVTALITKLQKNVEQVDVDHIYPNTLSIIIKSVPLLYSTELPGITAKSYDLTANGILIPSRNIDAKLPKIKIISPDIVETSFLDFKEVISPGAMKYIKTVSDILGSDLGIKEISYLEYFAVENEAHIITNAGVRLIFVLDSTIEKQLLGLKFAREKDATFLTQSGMIYIDARSIGKIFTCKDSTICLRNLSKIYGAGN